MAHIKPFRAIRFDEVRPEVLARMLCPPYDVIDDARQDELYNAHENNIVRIEFGKTSPSDHESDNRYTRASRDFNRWLREGVLRRDRLAAFYAIEETYQPPSGGAPVTRRGFLGVCKLVPFSAGVVLPHEKTLSAPKADRMALMLACNANLSPVFSLFDDSAGRARAALRDAPGQSVNTEFEGVKLRLTAITDPDRVRAIQEALQFQPVYIADGHHRYETALRYQKLRHGEGWPKDSPPDYVMMYLAPFQDEGLLIFPTHRVLHDLASIPANLEQELAKYFNIAPVEGDTAAIAARTSQSAAVNAFALVRPGEKRGLLLELKPGSASSLPHMPEEAALRELDVTVLHAAILRGILGISPGAQERKLNISYVKDAASFASTLNDGHHQLGFLMRSTRLKQVISVASSGGVMPQKSTYFYPKLPTGLVINPLF
ncbi:MAG: hypothetical protein GMKNLPBB_01224 [Myxococcota bacterium]|nr:hypothetical protein [Myxococcota bacterium]